MRRNAWFLVGGLTVALVLAFGVSRWASSQPDGLNRVSADHGLVASRQPRSPNGTPFAGYTVNGVHDRGLSTGLAGAVGVLATFGLCWGALRLAAVRSEGLR